MCEVGARNGGGGVEPGSLFGGSFGLGFPNPKPQTPNQQALGLSGRLGFCSSMVGTFIDEVWHRGFGLEGLGFREAEGSGSRGLDSCEVFASLLVGFGVWGLGFRV